MSSQRRIGMLIFPRLTQLDMTGPYEVLARLPNTIVDLVARSLDPVKTDRGMPIVPTVTHADCPQLDVVMVPGGPGQQDLMEDAVVLQFLQRQARNAKYVTSVCTGSLVLGAAGLLKGKRATCHWAAIEHLVPLGAIPVNERVVVDGNIVTAPASRRASTSHLRLRRFWKASRWRAKSNCRSSMILPRRSTPARRAPRRRGRSTPCGRGLRR